MNIEIVLEGKLKEPFYKAGAAEYKKRLSGYTCLKILEVPSIDEYLKNIKPNEYVITLEIEGCQLSSVQFAQKINELEKDGFYNKIVFLIGGSNGLSESAKNASKYAFSMSKLTFLHQEAVLILTEQIYRAMKILKSEPYHK